MEVTRIADGLWRWTAPHPEWTAQSDRPDGWQRMVGSVYFEPPAGEAGAIVLIDPLAPPSGSAEAETFWTALDRDVERARQPLLILISNGYHAREAIGFRQRYAGKRGAWIWASAEAVARLGFEPDRRFGAPAAAQPGVEILPIEGLDVGETAFFLVRHRVLVFGDAVIGAGSGRLAVAPPSWAATGEAAGALYRERFRASLRRLLDLDPAVVLPSHGEPVLERGRDALDAALLAPAWGE